MARKITTAGSKPVPKQLSSGLGPMPDPWKEAGRRKATANAKPARRSPRLRTHTLTALQRRLITNANRAHQAILMAEAKHRPIRDDALAALYLTGLPMTQIADETGVSHATVTRAVDAAR